MLSSNKIHVKKFKRKHMKKLTCHCEKVELEVNIPDEGFKKLMRCNCSLCKKKGAIMTPIPKETLKVVKGEDVLKLYQYHTKVAKHYFCSNCGIYTHHHPRSNPAMTGFNLGCVDEVDVASLKDITLIDGQNHPMDQKK